MNFTKKQKIAAYTYSLKEIELNYENYDSCEIAPYICDLLREYYTTTKGINRTSICRETLIEMVFTEILECRPTDAVSHAGWWDKSDDGYFIQNYCHPMVYRFSNL